jgi:hypothetical protein
MIDWCANQGRRTTTGAPVAREVVGVAGLSGIEKGAHMKSFYLKTAVAAVLMGAAAVAFAAPPEGKGPPNAEEEAGNNLSVPTIIVGGSGEFNINCGTDAWSGLVEPNATVGPLTGYEVNPSMYFYVQGVHEWQAPCMTYAVAPDPTVSVDASWGDNLGGDASLTVGSPIRVELVLTEYQGQLIQGYDVIKLEPSLLDRESKYGTEATSLDGGQTYSATPTDFVPGVYDAAATLSIVSEDGEELFSGPASAEINAKGKVVYGYNLRVPKDLGAGKYTITYNLPNLQIMSVDLGGIVGTNVVLTIDVDERKGGGGGGGKPNK